MLDKRQGACQDFARIAIGCLRGVIFGGGETHRLTVAVTVTRLDHRGAATARTAPAV